MDLAACFPAPPVKETRNAIKPNPPFAWTVLARRSLSPVSRFLHSFGMGPSVSLPGHSQLPAGARGAVWVELQHDYMRYGPPGVGVSPWNPIVQAQLNLGMRTAQYDMYNAWTANMYQMANLYNQQAIAQQIENARQMQQTMEPRYDVRKRTQRAPKSVEQSGSPLCRAIRFSRPTASCSGRVELQPTETWPRHARPPRRPSRSPSRNSRRMAKPRFRASSRPRNVSPHTVNPALKKLAARNMDAAKSLLRFLASLEQVINSLAGV